MIGVLEIARVCHEANRAFCLSIGDDSQKPWDEATQAQRDSAVKGVTFHLKGKHTPEESHESWMKAKLEAGWKLGETNDPDKKTHPSLVPYSELSEKEKSKDHIFGSIVQTMKDIMGQYTW